MLIAVRFHLFPFRTQKLSSHVSKILGWSRPGKIEQCRHKGVELSTPLSYSSIAQSVERMTVNHDVTGSSPVGGAKVAVKLPYE